MWLLRILICYAMIRSQQIINKGVEFMDTLNNYEQEIKDIIYSSKDPLKLAHEFLTYLRRLSNHEERGQQSDVQIQTSLLAE